MARWAQRAALRGPKSVARRQVGHRLASRVASAETAVRPAMLCGRLSQSSPLLILQEKGRNENKTQTPIRLPSNHIILKMACPEGRPSTQQRHEANLRLIEYRN